MRSSTPARGATLDSPPDRVTLTFTEQPDVKLSNVRVLNSSGVEVQDGKPSPVAGDKLSMSVGLGKIGNGVYTVSWRVVSRVDGHLTAGSYAFGVGEAPTAAPPVTKETTTPKPTVLAIAGRWLLYSGLALLFGYGIASLFLFDVSGRFVAPISWIAAAAGFAIMVQQQASIVGIPIGSLLSSETGSALIRLAIAIGAAGVIAGTIAIAGARAWLLWPLAAAAAGAMLARVLGGHAEGASSYLWLKVLAQWVHFMAAGFWVGGLAWLLRALKSRMSFDRARAVRNFSAAAFYAVLVAGATGAFRAITEVGSIGKLGSTGYGRAVLIKSALFIVILAIGALNRYRVVPRIAEAERSLRANVALELGVVVIIFAATGTMTGLAPPVASASSAQAKAPDRVVVSGSDFATTVRVRLTIAPGAAGPNLFRAQVTDFDSGAPVEAQRVTLRMSLPSRPDAGLQEVSLVHASGALWTAESTAMSIDGRWRIIVRVELATKAVEVTLRADTRLAPEETTVSRQAGQPTLYTIALPNGRSVQAYIDPGDKPGPNDVHFTFFNAQGNEFPVASATMEGAPPEGDAIALEVRRFGPGHFVASTDLTPGTWLFRVVARVGTETLNAYFRQRIP